MIKRFVLLAALTSCAGEESWTLPDEGDLAGAILEARPTDVSPPPPSFQLEVNNLTAGDYAELHITGATPGSLLRLVWGRSLGNGPCPAVLGGLCLSVASPVQVASFASIADDDGEAWMAIRIPPTRIAPVAFQVAAFGDVAEVSNPVQRQVSQSAGANDLDNDNDGFTPDGGDCADFDSSIHPSAADTIGDGLDQNCDNADGVDDDADGYASLASGGTDCIDADGDVWPGALEVCNDLDDDCDGVTDPVTSFGAPTFYLDGDGDNYGTNAGTTVACTAPVGYGAYNTDCNDSNVAIRPGATEIAGDEVDSDCSGGEVCFTDADDDGYRPNTTSTVTSADVDCGDANEALSADPTTDCNDASSTVNPGRTEVCGDGVDNNCAGGTDEGCTAVTSFTSTGSTTWTVPTGVTWVQVLVVGGGGGGGTGRGGAGGGAGGYVLNANYTVTPGAVIPVTVGAGGNGGTTTGGSTSGSASVFGTLTAPGGGAGGNFTGGGQLTGSTGGSGGGGAGGASYAGAAGTVGVGFAGGNGSSGAGGCYFGGGGGGANNAGGSALSGCGGGAGAGGSGKANSITGTSTYYAGGGSGSPVGTNTASLGGGGGGGGSLVNGNSNGIQVNGFPGTANTGGGGGGGGYGYSSATSYVYYPGGAGGSGVVIVRYCVGAGCTLPAP